MVEAPRTANADERFVQPLDGMRKSAAFEACRLVCEIGGRRAVSNRLRDPRLLAQAAMSAEVAAAARCRA